MNFLKKLFNTVTICCFSMLLMSLSCSKSDDDEVVTPLNDFGVQFKTDSTAIYKYLTTHYLKEGISDYPLEVNSSDLIKKIPMEGGKPSIYTLLTSTTFPKLSFKLVEKHDITYKVYYLQFQEGNTTEKPCPFDEVLVTYRGTSLKSETDVLTQELIVTETEFENSPVANLFNLGTVFVKGWPEIFPIFGKGVFDETATGNGPNAYTNYGAGIMFLPSGLAYYNQSPQTNIPSYSPLVFSFKLLNLKRIDNDNDGIMTVDELAIDSNGDYADTDLDGRDDFIDFDDDNDGYPTLNEIKKPTPFQGTSLYYPFNPVLDNPLTTNIDESEPKGIPDKSGDFSTPTRVRRHLDKTAKPPYTTY